jgi:hypothetical protein
MLICAALIPAKRPVPHSAAARCSALKNGIKDDVAFAHCSNDDSSHRLRVRAPDSALGDHAHGEGNLDAIYTISFARIRVGDITACVVVGDNEYAISARGRAGGVMKVLVDGDLLHHARHHQGQSSR